ncbi:unnamed protein product [Rotaria sp. Silwood2]|nr:unnamed protein product [Rotaria sp. Silwood2]CAF3959605.1 unnamed protein product [Rotaria sp. Silwood2]
MTSVPHTLTSQMEPTYTRSALPCVDEPSSKAIFDIRVKHDASYVVWANGELERSKILIDDRILSHFTPTIEHFVAPIFEGVAMKNYGLLIDVEDGLLFDENIGSTSQQQYVTAILTHEIVHQWFGNLVSSAWWGELSATQQDLWRYLTEATNNIIDVEHIMTGWTRQANYPIVEVNRIYTKTVHKLEQQRVDDELMIIQRSFNLLPSLTKQET